MPQKWLKASHMLSKMIKPIDYIRHNLTQYYMTITIQLAAKAYSEMASSDA